MTTIKYTHFLSEKEVLIRLKLLLTEVTFENNKLIYYLEEKWENNVGKFNFFIKKTFIEGKLKFDRSSVYIEINIPFHLFLLKIKLRKIILKKLNQILWYDKTKEYQFKAT